MDSVRINVTGDRQVALRFDTFPDELYDALRQEVDALSTELYARVEASTPSATGDLRSQERLRLFTDETRITGYVDISGSSSNDYAKAGALEYGSQRSAKVSTHQMKLDHYWSHKLAEPEMVLVDAYSRKPAVPEFAFERDPLSEMAPEIIVRLNAVVEKAIGEANA